MALLHRVLFIRINKNPKKMAKKKKLRHKKVGGRHPSKKSKASKVRKLIKLAKSGKGKRSKSSRKKKKR